MSSRKKTVSALELAETEVRQLKREAEIPRMKVSQAVGELQAYIDAHQNEDYLVRGFENTPKKNPFRKKKLNKCELF